MTNNTYLSCHDFKHHQTSPYQAFSDDYDHMISIMVGINIACTARINIQLGSLAIMCKRQPTNVMYCYHNMFVCLRIAPHWQDRFGKKYIFQFGRLEIEGNHKYAYLLAPPVYLCIWSKRKNGILQFGRLETLQIFVKALLFHFDWSVIRCSLQ